MVGFLLGKVEDIRIIDFAGCFTMEICFFDKNFD